MGRRSSYEDSDSDDDIHAGYHRLLKQNRWWRESSESPGSPVVGPGVSPRGSEEKHKPRNLVVCIDGTGNTFGRQTTNVLEVHGRLNRDHRQLVFYQNGIGTNVNESLFPLYSTFLVIKSMLEMAFAWNVDRTIKDAYKWLVKSYQPGDKIYLFGFSRGAYQVRALSGMIGTIGLLERGAENHIPKAYQLYMSQTSGTGSKTDSDENPAQVSATLEASWVSRIIGQTIGKTRLRLMLTSGNMTLLLLFLCSTVLEALYLVHHIHYQGVWLWVATWICIALMLGFCVLVSLLQRSIRAATKHSDESESSLEELIQAFKSNFTTRDAKVEFVGCWDTVSSIGPPWAKQPVLFEPLKHVQNFRHALALDECRVAFLPKYVDFNPKKAPKTNIKEVWFPGAHSDVGGNHSFHRDHSTHTCSTCSNPALDWMIDEAQACGLLLKKSKKKRRFWFWNAEYIKISNSLTPAWLLLEFLPWQKPHYSRHKQRISWRPHGADGRLILPGQRIHKSAFMSNYAPLAKLKKGLQMPLLEGETEDSLPFYNADILEMEAAPNDVIYYLQMPDSDETDGTILGVCASEVSHLIALFWIPAVAQACYIAYQSFYPPEIDPSSLSTEHVHNIFCIASLGILARVVVKLLHLDVFIDNRRYFSWMYEVNNHLFAFIVKVLFDLSHAFFPFIYRSKSRIISRYDSFWRFFTDLNDYSLDLTTISL